MKARTLKVFTWVFALLLCSTFAAANAQATNKVSAQEARQIAEDAYIYGYSLITTEVTRVQMTQEAILALGTEGYFNLMAKLMGSDAPPTKEDAPMLARMARIGIVPGKPFEMDKLDSDVQAALQDIPQAALKKIDASKQSMGEMVDGWLVTKGLGKYGTDYLKRALVAAFGWPANLQEDAVYPYTEADSNGQKLAGANKYTLTFPKGQTPPVNGFWSITMYEIDNGWWFVPNALNKFTVSTRDKLKYNTDGVADTVFPASVAWQGPGGQLATGTERGFPADAAHVLAEGERPIDHQRLVASAQSHQGEVNGVGQLTTDYRGRYAHGLSRAAGQLPELHV